ncbi:tape measure protein [Stutzerimonas nitrititolerans]|uniref:tape measure protein n=1 Tax=Stutzerimonas nitrititolerans TaxID=2482751 RepID=UPI0028A8AD6A|nr:tape measure protein [Stutzerimonas nitrititolerans]
MSIKDRLIQFVLRGKDELSPAAAKSEAALDSLRQEAEQLGQALDQAKEAQGLNKALQQTERATTQAQRNLSQAENQVEDLREALNKTPDAAGLQQSLKEAEREAARARRQLNGLTTQLDDVRSAAKGAGIDTDNLADEERRLAAEVDKAQGAVKENNQALKAAQREHNAAARAAAEHTSRINTARESMSRGAKQVLAFAAAYVSLNAAFGLVQRGLNVVRDGIFAMLKTGDEFEGLDTRMASLMGSLAAGEQATEWIKQFAKDTPLVLQDVTESFALLKSYGLDPMDGSLQALVDKNEQLGGGMERLQGIVSAVGQAWAKEKLQTEEILQLVERGVPVWQMLADVTGKNAAELQELASKGKLGRDVIKQLVAEIGKSADGAATANMRRLSGIMSNLADTATDFYNRIANAGALEYVKGRLMELAETIDQMDKDGRLDALATSLSNAFIQGAQWVENFASKLLTVDFAKLTTDSSNWLNSFGSHLDAAAQRVQLFVAPFRTLFNGLTAGLSGFAALITGKMSDILGAVVKVAEYLPNMLGGEKLRAAVADARGVLDGLTEGFREQVEQDGKDIAAAWSTTTETVKTKAAEQTAAVKQEVDDQFEHIVQRVTDMNNALAQIDAAEGAAQLKQLGEEMYKAYQRGDLSQQQFASGMAIVQARLKALGAAAGGAAGFVSDLEDKLGDLSKVQAAISNAKTDVDINNIRTALKKLYGDGQITAAQYNEELKKAADRQRELKGAIDDGAAAQAKKNDADKEAIKTSADLRVESGKRMEAERRAGDQAMQDRRRGSEEAQRDMGAMEDFFGGVMSRAREPLAAMSDAALEAFDRLNGLSTANIEMDTSSLDATTSSLRRATEALDDMQAAANTVGMSAIGKWMTQTALQSQQLQIQFLGQKARLQSLMEGYEDGSITVQQFVRRASSARHAMSLLNDSDLRTLESAIQAAKDRMEQMANSTRSTLEGLQDELDNLQGRTEDIERRRFASRRRELEAQMAEANAQGDSQALANAARALGMLRQIESETAQQRQREEQQKRIDAQQQPQGAAPQQAEAPGKVIRLEIPGRQAVDVAVRSEADETKLLGVLESAGLRSL